MNELPSKALFEQVAIELAVASALVEKDWHVTQVLAFLSNLNCPGFELVFSGGTALSKAHGLIQRFSEDIDFLAIAAEPSPSRQTLSGFKNAVVTALREAGFAIEDGAITARDSNRFFAIDINYETHFGQMSGLRPHIQVEVTVHSPELSALYLPVSSLLNKVMKRPPEVESIACTAPVESAANKLSALVWRVPDRVRSGQTDDRSLVRHIHDLAALEKIAEKDTHFPGLVMASLKLDNARPKNVPSFSTLSKAEKFTLMLHTLAEDSEYPKEYDIFVKSVSYARAGTEPDFGVAMEAVRRLTKIVLAS